MQDGSVSCRKARILAAFGVLERPNDTVILSEVGAAQSERQCSRRTLCFACAITDDARRPHECARVFGDHRFMPSSIDPTIPPTTPPSVAFLVSCGRYWSIA